MRNVWAVFSHDIRRAGGSVIALIISIGLILMPSFYAWFNIYGSWNPYDSTGGVKVAVANEDKGYQGDLLPNEVNVGDRVVSALRANDSLGWTFVDADEAREGVRSGDYYAAIVIPEDFSADLFTLLSDDVRHANIIYYSNPKRNPIASTVTNQGASAVRTQINRAFTGTITETAVGTIESLLSYLDSDQGSKSVSTLGANLRRESESLSSAAGLATDYAGLARSAASMLDASATALNDAKAAFDGRSASSADLSGKLDEAAGALSQADAGLTAGFDALASGFDAVGENAAGALDGPEQGASDVAARLRAESTDKVQPMIAALGDYRAALADLRDKAATDAAKAALDRAIGDVDRTLDRLNAYDAKLNDTADSIEAKGQAAGQAAKDLTDQAAAGAQAVRDLKTSYRTNVAGSLADVADSARQAGQDARDLIDAAALTLAQVTSGSGADGTQGVTDTIDGVNAAADRLDEAHDQLAEQSGKLAQAADTIDEAMASGGVDAVRQLFSQPTSDLVGALTAPVSINRKAVFPVSNNGSAMAPFYTLMAIWVGITFLGLILTPNVSGRLRDSLPDRVRGWQLYAGRGLTFTAFAMAQATILGLGDLLYLRVQTVNPFLFMLCLWWTAFVCSVFIYTLASVFGNIGKAVSTTLMIAQIAGIGGTFPVQMLSSGFRELYPYLPFSHAITALRETVGGFYGNVYWEQMGRLGLYLAFALLIGFTLYTPVSRRMARTNELVASTGVMG